MTDLLELYQTETCPYCQNGREKLSNLGVSYVIHNPRLGGKSGGDVTNQQTYDELIGLGGADQVPFLVDTARGESIYESDDIVEYVEEQYA